MRRVVVTGLGMVSPLGGNVETSWKNIIASKSGAASGAGAIRSNASAMRVSASSVISPC